MNEINLLCQARSIVIKAPRKNGELHLMKEKRYLSEIFEVC